MEKPVKANILLDQLREITGSSLYQAENGLITLKAFKPINEHTETLVTITEDNNLMRDPTPFPDMNADSQITRVEVFYQPTDESRESKKPEEYGQLYVRIDADIEDERNFNTEIAKQVFSPWIYREQEARRLSTKVLRRFRLPPAKYKFSLDPKDFEIQLAQIIDITTSDFLKNDGTPDTKRFEITSKQERTNRIDIESLDSKQDRLYGWINHTSAADHGAATATEKFHAYIGTAVTDEDAAVMGDGTDGYYFW